MGARQLVALALAFFLAGCGQSTDGAVGGPHPGLAFSVSLPKTAFSAGEAIPLTLALHNTSSETLTVNSRLAINDRTAPADLREVFLRIKMPSGQEASFRWDVTIAFADADDFTDLNPGESVQLTADLAERYALRQAGEYTVRAIYQNTRRGPVIVDDATGDIEESDVGAVRVRLAAPRITFRIT